MLIYFKYIVQIFKVINQKNRIFLVLFFLCSILLAFLETLSVGILALFVGFIANPEVILNKIPVIELRDYFNNLNRSESVFQISMIIILAFILKNVFIIFINWFSLRVRQSITSDNSKESFNNILNFDYRDFLNFKKSELTYKIYNEIKRIAAFIVGYNLLLKEIILISFLSVSLLLINATVFFSIIFIFTLFFLIITLLVKSYLTKAALKINKHSSLMLGSISEIIDNINLIKLTSKKNFFLNKYLNNINLNIRY